MEIKELRQMVNEVKTAIETKVTKHEEQIKSITDKIESIEKEQKNIIDELVQIKNVKGGVVNMEDRTELEKKAFFNYVRNGKVTEEIKALVSDATGSVLVPKAVFAEILTQLPSVNWFRALARKVNVGTDNLDIRSLTGLQVGWGKIEAGKPITESSMTPAKRTVYVENLYGITKIGELLLQDVDANLEQIVVESFADAIGKAEQAGFLFGRGHTYEEPEGVFQTTLYTDKETASTGTISIDDVIDVYYSLKEQYRQRAVWIVAKAAVKYLRKLKDNTGNYIWQNGIANAMPDTLLGKPVYVVEELDNIGSGDYALAFGDFANGYLIVDRVNGMMLQRLNELYAEQGMVGFKVLYRVGGAALREDAVVRLKVK